MDLPSRITPRDLECMLCDETADPKALPLLLLEEITCGFSGEQEIGRGGFAVVYKGMLENRAVAVKRMSNTYMYEKEFHREVECLMMVKHKNVVRFLGYCADTQGSMERYNGKYVMADVQQRLLCFEHFPKGSLREYITGTSSGLKWRDRYEIIKGVCQGLHYLHEKKIVHLDLKPENILLDDNWVAKITDFGLSRCFDEMQSRVITLNIGGTFGYLAPEFGNGEITYQLDIYSLGVIIIEILTGKKGYQVVDNVIESWSNMLEESQRDEQLEQVRVCAEIGMECTDFNPAKRLDTQHIINRLDEEIATAVPLGGTNPCNGIGEKGNNKKLNEILHSLNPDIRRCFEFCSILPRGSKLRRDDLVRLWIAQGFIKEKTSCATEDMEDIAEGYIQELVSSSFLEPIETSSLTDCVTIPDVLHDKLDKFAGKCFRIENESSHSGEGWEGDVPRDIHHLLIQHYDGELIAETIIGLEYLRTLIVYIVETQIAEEVIDNICKKLPELRVLDVAFSEEYDPVAQLKHFSFPESVGQLKCLRYLAFRTSYHFRITLPRTLNKLQHIQTLDFGESHILEATFDELVNLRHIFCSCSNVELPYIGRLSSLQTLQDFHVRNKQGCKLKQLRDLNKLRGKLRIRDLQYVKSKEEALEANLAAKERLTELELWWRSPGIWRLADVLEGLCPPAGLQKLSLREFGGLRYPDWMMHKHGGGPKYLQELHLWSCSQPVPAFDLAGAFPHLHVFKILWCDWDTLPSNMEHLTSLKELTISSCKNIRSLPPLPQSLEYFCLAYCNDELMKSCQTAGHPNWQKIEHIPSQSIDRQGFFGWP